MKSSFQAINSPYNSFIRQESEMFYQASLLLEEDKHILSWALFALWKGLTPFESWQDEVSSQTFLRKLKKTFLFQDAFDDTLTVPDNAWMDLHEAFTPYDHELLLKLYNGLEASSGTIRFPTFVDLDFYLRCVGASVALVSAHILFHHEMQSGNCEFVECVNKLGMGVLWWSLLKETHLLVQEGRLFIPLEDLVSFNCSEEDLLNARNSKEMKDLTKYELERVVQLLRINKKNNSSYPKGLKEVLCFISNQLTDQVHSALHSGWTLADVNPPDKKPIKKSWFINGITHLQRNSNKVQG